MTEELKQAIKITIDFLQSVIAEQSEEKQPATETETGTESEESKSISLSKDESI